MSRVPMILSDSASSLESSPSKNPMTKQTRRADVPGAQSSATAVMPERERPAGTRLYPEIDAPAAQQSASAEVPKRGRRVIVDAKPELSAPADQTSASGRADETISAPQPSAVASRRQNSRATKNGASPAPIIEAVEPRPSQSEPGQITNDAGPGCRDTLSPGARVRRADQTSIDTQRPGVSAAPIAVPGGNGGGDDRAQFAPDSHEARSPVVAEIRALYRLRVQWLKAELRQVLQAQAICRQWVGAEGDTEKDLAKQRKLASGLYGKFVKGEIEDPGMVVQLEIALTPFLDGMKPYREQGAIWEKRLAKAAKSLSVWPWAEKVSGLSAYGLAKIVGEAGDIGSYRNPSCLWKRMGLAPHGGKAMDVWRKKGGLSADEWAEAGYAPSRRSTAWNIGSGLIGHMGHGPRPSVGQDWANDPNIPPLEKLFLSRLIYEAERDPEHMARPTKPDGKMSFSAHASNRAKRYVEKRMLRLLWAAWRASERGEEMRLPTFPESEPEGFQLLAAAE